MIASTVGMSSQLACTVLPTRLLIPLGNEEIRMSLTISKRSNPTALALAGRLDTHTAPELDQELDRVLHAGDIQQLIFDLTELEYLSSAGIRCFVRARKFIEPRGGKVAIVNPQPGVRKVLDIVKAMPSTGIFGSIAELDEYLDAMQRQVRDQE
jgi:anti-anti-sigma factor